MYQTIVFMNEYQDEIFEEIMWDRCLEDIATYLSQWDCGDPGTVHSQPWGSGDQLSEHNINGVDYILAVNYGLGYAALMRKV